MAKSIHIGVFIDGTGNHKGNDEIIGNGTQSNVAKLAKVWSLTEGNLEPVYIPGVGTKSLEELGFNTDKREDGTFKDPELQAIKEGKSNLTDHYDSAPMATGYSLFGRGIEDQVDEAYTKIKKHIKDIHTENPNTPIEIDIIGFSRGAASERVLINRLHEEGITKQGNNVEINHAGLFDTVSAVGIANGDTAPFNLNLNSYSANHIVQYTSLDEHRANFRSKAMPEFDVPVRADHSDNGGSHGILDNKEYYAQFKNYTVDNDKVDNFINQQREEAKASGYEGISYTTTSLDRHNQSSVYIGYVQSKEVKYGLSHVTLNKMYDEMKTNGVPMTELSVLGNVENNDSYSLWEIPKELQEHPENVTDYIHNSSVDRSRVYPAGEDFRRASTMERTAHHPEKSGVRSIDMNEPSKAEHPRTIADEMDESYAYGQDSTTTMRLEDTGMHVADTFIVKESAIEPINSLENTELDTTLKAQEIVDNMDLPEYDNSMDYGMEIGD